MGTWWQSLSGHEQLAALTAVIAGAAFLLDLALGEWPTAWLPTAWLREMEKRTAEPDEDRRRQELTIAATFSQASFNTPAAKGFEHRPRPQRSGVR